jgi:hypothetical protein
MPLIVLIPEAVKPPSTVLRLWPEMWTDLVIATDSIP